MTSVSSQNLRSVITDVTDPVSSQMSRPVTRPPNLVSNKKMEWKVVRRDGYLEIFPTCGQSRGNVFRILMNLGLSLIIRRCPHDSASPLENANALADDRGPFLGHPASSEAEARVELVAVDGETGLRMFAVSNNIIIQAAPLQVVNPSDFCLQCRLNPSRRARCRYSIC